MGGSNSRTASQHSITWEKNGNRWKTSVDGKLTQRLIQDMLANAIDQPGSGECSSFFERARDEVGNEFSFILYNVTLVIHSDPVTFTIISGSGDYRLDVKKENGEVVVEWGQSVCRSAAHFAEDVARKAVKYLGKELLAICYDYLKEKIG